MSSKFVGSKSFYVLIAAAVIVLVFFAYYSRAGPEITATGQASVKAEPDLVSVYVLVETRNSSAELAQKANSELTEKVLARLAVAGFDSDSVKLAYYNTYPDYDWSNNKQTLKGYVVSQQLILYLPDFSKVPGAVSEVVSAGALVSSINFELSSKRQNEYKTQLLSEASIDAKNKAKAIANGLGKDLGRLIAIETEDSYYPGPIAYYSRAGSGSVSETFATDSADAKQAAQSLTPQDIDMSASVSVRYRLS